MPKVTKAIARKRLKEAQNKINTVMFVSDLNLSKVDNFKLGDMWADLSKIILKLK
jgi:hypothetical protein